MGFFAHAQTVDTRPLFPPPTWPGYEARDMCIVCSLECVCVREEEERYVLGNSGNVCTISER